MEIASPLALLAMTLLPTSLRGTKCSGNLLTRLKENCMETGHGSIKILLRLLADN
jgi:hypothetical protein